MKGLAVAATPRLAAAALLLLLSTAGPRPAAAQEAAGAPPSFYSSGLSAVDSQGKERQMSEFAGKVTLVVNVASLCGYTDSNYLGLNAVYNKYREYGFEVLAFPCNQFGEQEPASIPEVVEFLAGRYAPQYPFFSKIEVNGPGAHPVFKWLKEQAPAAPGREEGDDVAWNFEKFLVDKSGRPVAHLGSEFVVHEMEKVIFDALVKGTEHGAEL